MSLPDAGTIHDLAPRLEAVLARPVVIPSIPGRRLPDAARRALLEAHQAAPGTGTRLE